MIGPNYNIGEKRNAMATHSQHTRILLKKNDGGDKLGDRCWNISKECVREYIPDISLGENIY